MSIQDLGTWAKNHKREFANKKIKDAGVRKHEKPSAIFMAGLPGSGKTEFTKWLMQNTAFRVVRIDMDEIAAQIDTYRPEIADRFRPIATTLMNELFSRTTRQRMDFIMDGTFSSGRALSNVKKVLTRGYSVKIIYLHQDPKVAWEFTEAREKVERRAISLGGFVEAYFRLISNLRKLDNPEYKGAIIDLVVKDARNRVGRLEENISIKDIDQKVKIMYNEDELRKYIHE